MLKKEPSAYAQLYFDALLEDVMPFWEKHSLDGEHGGYFTCLDRFGSVYDTDKFLWLQGRQIWMFSKLYNEVHQKQQWIDVAAAGIDFLTKHGQDEQGHYYFSLTRDGRPLTHAYNIYSDCFAALAWYEYGRASGISMAMDKARQAFDNFLVRRSDPKGRFEKSTGVRPQSNFGLGMMTAYLAFEMESLIGEMRAAELYDQCLEEILVKHYDQSSGLIREVVHADGHFLDTFEGRLVSPGHNLEVIWFLMDIANRLGREKLVLRLVDMCLHVLERCWDHEKGGIYYFIDIKGAPSVHLEHDQKLWWVHLEGLIALSRAWLLSGRADVINWFEILHDYVWQRFPDPQYGEWFGYLSRQGEPHLTLKGGKWKGCFHVPRALYECARSLQAEAES
ncbi:MAG: AGE family epimerase/isomerase [Saprospiraceae bacterium]|nr:AGE family epimerase/isomerase [Saprospiraceae bacterium]